LLWFYSESDVYYVFPCCFFFCSSKEKPTLGYDDYLLIFINFGS